MNTHTRTWQTTFGEMVHSVTAQGHHGRGHNGLRAGQQVIVDVSKGRNLKNVNKFVIPLPLGENNLEGS